MAGIAAELVDLGVHFRDSGGAWTARLEGVDLRLDAGTVHALVGESGAGKSLVIAALTGLLPATARLSGRVSIGGRELSAGSQAHWRQVRGRTIGVVPQSAATFLTPTRTVGAQLREAVAELQGPAVETLCEQVGLEREVLRRYPHQISGGMAQRVGLACALAGRPAVILADEPTSALDPELTSNTLQLLSRCADAGAAVLVVTHDLADLLDAGIADTVSVLRAGRLLAAGPIDHVFVPDAEGYVGALLRALPRNGLQL